MTLPALKLLEDSGYTPMLVGKRWAEDLFAGTGYRFDPIEGHVTEDITRIRYLSNYVGPKPLGILFPNSFSSALLFRMGNIQSAGFKTDMRRFLLTTPLEEPGPMHEVERFFRVVYDAIVAWGGTPAYDKPQTHLGLRLMLRHEAAARNLIERHQIPKRFALLAPVARGLHHGKTKHWAYFNALCPVLRSLGVEPIVFPSPDEEIINQRACPDATILPPTTLGNYAALAQLAEVVIANDSGISHVAASVSAKQITLMGVTTPERTGPWNPDAVVLGSANAGWPSIDEVTTAIKAMVKPE